MRFRSQECLAARLFDRNAILIAIGCNTVSDARYTSYHDSFYASDATNW